MKLLKILRIIYIWNFNIHKNLRNYLSFNGQIQIIEMILKIFKIGENKLCKNNVTHKAFS